MMSLSNYMQVVTKLVLRRSESRTSWLRQIGGPESSAPQPGRLGIRATSGSAKRAAMEQKGERRQPELSLRTVAKNIASVREVNHKVDIVATDFYSTRVRGGWLGLGGEKVRTFGSETRPSWNLSACCFWLPGVHVAKGAQVADFFRGEQVGLSVLGLQARLAWRTTASV